MKNYEVKYTKGHLVDVKTGKRVFLKGGGSFNILGDDDQFEERDELKDRRRILDSEEKIASLKKKFKGFLLEKIASANQVFVYRIGIANYFPQQRSGTCNAFKSFFELDISIEDVLKIPSENLLFSVKNKFFVSLESKRLEVQNKYKKQEKFSQYEQF